MSGEHLALQLTCGTPRVGLWCDTCLLPSRFEIPVYALGENGPFCIGTVNRCEGCHQ